jgi:uncharacterized protein YjbI with pentapeptide repeats
VVLHKYRQCQHDYARPGLTRKRSSRLLRVRFASGLQLALALIAGLAACSEPELGPGVDARERDLSGRSLASIDLTGANLGAAKLRGSDLSGAVLLRAHLAWADLQEAELTRADLSWASLERADLRGARLVEAKLAQALLTGAHLAGADLSGVGDVTALQLSRAHCWDEETRLPAGIDLQPANQPHE